jgi:hypothetical protein
MNKLAVAKKTVTTIVGFGITKIVKGIVENNVDTTSITSKVTVTAASTAIGYSLSELTSNYTDTKIDELVALYNKHVKNRNVSEE